MSPLFTSVSSSSLLFSYVAEREFSVCSAPTRCFGGGKRYSCVSRTPRFKRQKAISCCQRQITDAAYPLPLILHQQHTSNSKMPVSFDICFTRRASYIKFILYKFEFFGKFLPFRNKSINDSN